MKHPALTRLLTILFITAALLFCTGPLSAASSAPLVDARGVMIMNLKSESVLYIQDENRKIPPASIAKIMTMYLIMDRLDAGAISLSDMVRISANAASQPGSTMGLKAGEKVALGELVKGVAVASGNDAAVAVAEYISGSVPKFVAAMNAKAKALGMKNTTFTNPSGLPPATGQWTTAKDMLTLTKRYLEDYPDALPYHSMPSVTHGATTTTNKNKLLKLCPGADGIKTGWIRASGFSLVSTAKRGDVRIVCVLLGASTSQAMTEESLFLMEAAFETVRSGGVNKVKYQLQERAKARAEADEETEKEAEAKPEKKVKP